MPDIPYALPENTELSDWIPHNGGPRPVTIQTRVQVDVPGADLAPALAATFPWQFVTRYRILRPKQPDSPDLRDMPKPTSPNDHYRQGDIECIDAIRAALTDEEWRGYCKGSIIGYVWRERHKGGDEDLIKSQDFLRWALAGKAEGKR
jgi:hypothetical protein